MGLTETGAVAHSIMAHKTTASHIIVIPIIGHFRANLDWTRVQNKNEDVLARLARAARVHASSPSRVRARGYGRQLHTTIRHATSPRRRPKAERTDRDLSIAHLPHTHSLLYPSIMAHEERFIPERQKLDQLSVIKDYATVPRLEYR